MKAPALREIQKCQQTKNINILTLPYIYLYHTQTTHMNVFRYKKIIIRPQINDLTCITDILFTKKNVVVVNLCYLLSNKMISMNPNLSPETPSHSKNDVLAFVRVIVRVLIIKTHICIFASFKDFLLQIWHRLT
jgi:hypothetical protein